MQLENQTQNRGQALVHQTAAAVQAIANQMGVSQLGHQHHLYMGQQAAPQHNTYGHQQQRLNYMYQF